MTTAVASAALEPGLSCNVAPPGIPRVERSRSTTRQRPIPDLLLVRIPSYAALVVAARGQAGDHRADPEGTA